MKIAMMQPAFLPWQGLFELILNADRFIFLDDFQYCVQSHHTRNKLFVNKNQVDFYCVPVQKSKCFELNLNEALIVENNQWKSKLLKRLQYNYLKAGYYNEIMPKVEAWLDREHKTLSEINIDFIKLASEIMGIKTEFLYSSDFSKETRSQAMRSQKVLELLKWGGATTYLSANGSFGYMMEDKIFPVNDIEILFQNFEPSPYPQIGTSNEFVPFLSVLDALFNVGAEKTLELIKGGTKKWLTWNDMLEAKNSTSIGHNKSVGEFTIKLATIEDMQDVFDLSNDELVRANSFNQEKISWEEHCKWYKNKINDENSIFYLVKDPAESLISQVRLEKINQNEGDISISISQNFRGKGYGVTILKSTTEKVATEHKINKINAYIKEENLISQAVFSKAEYVLKEKSADKMRYEYNAK